LTSANKKLLEKVEELQEEL